MTVEREGIRNMSFAPPVSVIVPVYNNEDYLDQCVRSILQQTYHNLEIVLVDDGSTDNSGKLCDQYRERDPRVTVIHKENGGLSSARKTGVENAHGEYVMCVDSDDWLDVESIERCVEAVEKNDVACVAFSYVREYENASFPVQIYSESRAFTGEEAKQFYRRIWGLYAAEMAHPERLDSLVSFCMKLYSADLLKNARYFDTKVVGGSEDALLNIYALRNCRSFYYINQPFYHYRKQAGTLSSTYRRRLIEQYRTLYECFDQAKEELKIDDECIQAYINRTALTIIGIGGNESKNPRFRECVRRIREYIKTPRCREAYQKMQYAYMPFVWKVFFFFVKRKMAFTVYLMLLAIRFLRNRI